MHASSSSGIRGEHRIDLASIAARAATLDERLTGAVVPDGSADDEIAEKRLAAWKEAVGGAEALERRLAWDGLSVEDARAVLGHVRLAQSRPLPTWCRTLADALGAQTQFRPLSNQESPLAFQEVVEPFLAVGCRRLYASAAAALLSSEAREQLERSLLAQLSEIAAPALMREFAADTATEQPPFRRLYDLAAGFPRRMLYERFVARMRNGGLEKFFLASPALARSLASTTDQWVDSTVEFLNRLHADWPKLRKAFAPEAHAVITIRPGLSDPHNGGRTVTGLELDSGAGIIYKPKDVGAEAAFGALLRWLNAHGARPTLYAPRVLRRVGYGWVSRVEHAPFRDEANIAEYFQRAGFLLAILQVLEATDMHCENVIANPHGPVVVDLETLFHPRLAIAVDGETNAEAIAERWLSESALRVGLLPVWELTPDRTMAYEHAGLAGAAGQKIPLVVRRWLAVNTDQMHLEYVQGRTEGQENRVLVRDVEADIHDYENDLIAGYSRGYSLLAKHHGALVVPGGPIERLADERFRCIVRDTIKYGAVLEEICRPRYSRDGIDRSLRIEILGRSVMAAPQNSGAEPAAIWALVAAERRAIERGDVPVFTVSPRGTVLDADGAALARCVESPSYSNTLQRLAALNDGDRERQIDVIRAAVGASRAHRVDARPDPEPSGELRPAVGLGDRQLIHEAEAIGELLLARAILGADGTATWLGVQLAHRVSRFEVEPISYCLYDGSLGITLFFASLAAVSSQARWREAATLATESWRRTVAASEPRAKLAQAVGIGGGVGVGSFIYGATAAARLMDEPNLLDLANTLTDTLTPDLIAADQDLDVLCGTAGTILGLLSLYDTLPSRTVLACAEVCGRHLLASNFLSPSGERSCTTPQGKLLAGFSHGAAGIAYALLRLYAATGDESFRHTAIKAIHYERTLFVSERENWVDLRIPDDLGPPFTARWCHGAPGIALARLEGLEVNAQQPVLRDIDAGLRTTAGQGLTAVDNLCCGNLGRADVLLTAGRKLQRPELVASARAIVTAVVNKAAVEGGYALGRAGSTGMNPGLFSGLAGIGYQLVRMVASEEVPSVLAYD